MSQQATTPIVSGDAAILARRYAAALYDLADEQKQLDAVAADLRALRNLLAESEEFRTVAAHPRLTRPQLVQAMQKVAETANLNKLTANFLSLTAQNRRTSMLGPIIEEFLSQLAARRGEYSADVFSAKPLSPAQQEQLATKLRELAGGKVHITAREDASLLGGLVVKMGSRLIDASIKTKLARMERQLKQHTMDSQKGAA
ncbi:MAG TPA: F0F1 ATP synthase subunit delta [Alphaproteobacteria bacterium]|nr:F0F1 ATP synthase subunit delta [Alphaproteobacteria bacterium]